MDYKKETRLATPSEAEAMHRKVTLIMSMAGQETDTAMTVLLYAVAIRAVAEGVTIESIVENFAFIYTQVERDEL
jgi:hypothetical protein